MVKINGLFGNNDENKLTGKLEKITSDTDNSLRIWTDICVSNGLYLFKENLGY